MVNGDVVLPDVAGWIAPRASLQRAAWMHPGKRRRPVVLLASPHSSFTSGAHIVIDGALTPRVNDWVISMAH